MAPIIITPVGRLQDGGYDALRRSGFTRCASLV